MKKGIKAILFDLDGTLIDSEAIHFACWNELLSDFNIAITWNEYLEKYSGVSVPENAQTLINTLNISSTIQTLAQRREDLYLKRLASQELPLMPHGLEALTFCHGHGMAMGLVTSSSRQEVDVIIKRTGLSRFFKVVVTRDDVKNFKPNPEPYLSAARMLGFDNDEYLVFEDTHSGVSSAKRAGLQCFAIQSQKAHVHKLLNLADRTFPTFEEAINHLLQFRYFDIVVSK